MHNQGFVLTEAGRLTEAADLYERAAALFQDVGDFGGQIYALEGKRNAEPSRPLPLQRPEHGWLGGAVQPLEPVNVRPRGCAGLLEDRAPGAGAGHELEVVVDLQLGLRAVTEAVPSATSGGDSCGRRR